MEGLAISRELLTSIKGFLRSSQSLAHRLRCSVCKMTVSVGLPHIQRLLDSFLLSSCCLFLQVATPCFQPFTPLHPLLCKFSGVPLIFQTAGHLLAQQLHQAAHLCLDFHGACNLLSQPVALPPQRWIFLVRSNIIIGFSHCNLLAQAPALALQVFDSTLALLHRLVGLAGSLVGNRQELAQLTALTLQLLHSALSFRKKLRLRS
mmetsp:Transcript_137590/g.253049  ORF Transcript_137590/g.253049 Transcript_137590/m.253049 type:complete len:205 (+) Transcript_137590:1270-1884(+)